MTFRPILALAAAAALALPAAALAEDGSGSGRAPLPACSAAQLPAPAASARHEGDGPGCAIRVCAAGQASTPDVPCLAPCAPDVRPTRDAPCAPVPAAPAASKGNDAGAGDGAGAGDAPANGLTGDKGHGNGLGSLRARVWRLTAEADGFDTTRHALTVAVDSVDGVSPRVAARLSDALGDQADVLVGTGTRVLDAGGHRLTGDAAATALDAADTVKVTAKLAPAKLWAKDEDGTPIPALRALRVRIVS